LASEKKKPFQMMTGGTGTRTSSHVREAGEEEGKEEVEDHQIADEDGGHEVGDAGAPRHEDAVPHGLYPLPAQHAEHDHEAEKMYTFDHASTEVNSLNGTVGRRPQVKLRSRARHWSGCTPRPIEYEHRALDLRLT